MCTFHPKQKQIIVEKRERKYRRRRRKKNGKRQNEKSRANAQIREIFRNLLILRMELGLCTMYLSIYVRRDKKSERERER